MFPFSLNTLMYLIKFHYVRKIISIIWLRLTFVLLYEKYASFCLFAIFYVIILQVPLPHVPLNFPADLSMQEKIDAIQHYMQLLQYLLKYLSFVSFMSFQHATCQCKTLMKVLKCYLPIFNNKVLRELLNGFNCVFTLNNLIIILIQLNRFSIL
jgi:hypothetical protein